MRVALFYWGPAALCAGLVLFLSLRPDSGAPGYGWDKAHHFTAYAVMSYLFMRFAAWKWGRPSKGMAVAVILAASLFGIGVEFIQSLTVTRNADAFDALANSLGSILGVAVFSLIKNRTEVKGCL
jgi:VanZ family protein